MRVCVLGCGRWGSFIAWYLNHIGHEVLLYGREGSKNLAAFRETRGNGLLCLPEEIVLSCSLDEAVRADTLIISIESQSFRALMRQLSAFDLSRKTLVLCMKGLEQETCARLSEIAAEYATGCCRIAVWLGPGHVQEFIKGVPNCMVIDSACEQTKHMLVEVFSSELIRFYYGQDLLGNEIGAAAKNVIGIAAGIIDGLELSTLKGALASRGAREVGLLIAAMGGNEITAYGLCHLGDYGATVFSPYSHNRMYGEALARGQRYDKLAEGVYTVRALRQLGRQYNVELPICNAVYDVLYGGMPAQEAVEGLFTRSLKREF